MTPRSANSSGEWWEVVEKDGTRWQLGSTTGSEQLAAMVGYPGTNPPTGAWATLGYAGNEPNVVASRWRADQVTDVFGNRMAFTYFEETRAVAGTTANYDRASYIETISYTSHTSGIPTAGYSVAFVRESRGTDDVPTVPADWDNWDTYRLDRIDVNYIPYGAVRTYDLGYAVRSYSDGVPLASWKTTMLSSVAVSGLGTIAPTVTFGYADKDNRAAQNANSIEWAYPRLTTINNGWGGVSTYTYENDGRAYTSWYNWRVQEQTIADGVNASPMKTTFAYSTPCYNDSTIGWCNAGNVGGLIGYEQATATVFAFDGINIKVKTVHKFYTYQNWYGLEYETLFQDAVGTTLRKTVTGWMAVEVGGDFSGINFRYSNLVEQYLLVPGTGLVRVSHLGYAYNQ